MKRSIQTGKDLNTTEKEEELINRIISDNNIPYAVAVLILTEKSNNSFDREYFIPSEKVPIRWNYESDLILAEKEKIVNR